MVDLQNQKPLKEIVTGGLGFFMRSHTDSPYTWADAFLGRKHDEILLIDKQTLEIAHHLHPSPGKVAGHVEFARDGRYALPSVWDRDGALAVYDTYSLEEMKRLPMNKPSGKYNVGNKTGYTEGTSHRGSGKTPSADIPISFAADHGTPAPSRYEKNHGNGG